jgi:hypothetical protein
MGLADAREHGDPSEHQLTALPCVAVQWSVRELIGPLIVRSAGHRTRRKPPLLLLHHTGRGAGVRAKRHHSQW